MLGGSDSFLSMAFESGFVVSLVLLILLFASIGCWAVILYKFIALRIASRQSRNFIEIFADSGSFGAVLTQVATLKQSPLAQIFRAGYAEWLRGSKDDEFTDVPSREVESKDVLITHGGQTNVERSLRRAIDTESTKLESLLIFLATVASAAPFIGLFGTVWGIMESFREIGITGSANLAVVAPGISEALIATATGLAAAIPAVVAYNYFNNYIRVMNTEMEAFGTEFINVVSRNDHKG
jgi:biopolymer transport protein TolQ